MMEKTKYVHIYVQKLISLSFLITYNFTLQKNYEIHLSTNQKFPFKFRDWIQTVREWTVETWNTRREKLN